MLCKGVCALARARRRPGASWPVAPAAARSRKGEGVRRCTAR